MGLIPILLIVVLILLLARRGKRRDGSAMSVSGSIARSGPSAAPDSPGTGRNRPHRQSVRAARQLPRLVALII
jgi:hypothetical protein